MKKSLFFLSALLFCGFNMYAQSIKFNDLVYFTTLNNQEIHDNLLQNNAFRQDYGITIDGHDIQFFKSTGTKPNSERIEVGNWYRLYNGTVLHTVKYTTTDAQNIINMISQAKRYGLDLKFRGFDPSNSIYLYDNELYHVSIYLKNDQSSGLVEIKQKEVLNVE